MTQSTPERNIFLHDPTMLPEQSSLYSAINKLRNDDRRIHASSLVDVSRRTGSVVAPSLDNQAQRINARGRAYGALLSVATKSRIILEGNAGFSFAHALQSTPDLANHLSEVVWVNPKLKPGHDLETRFSEDPSYVDYAWTVKQLGHEGAARARHLGPAKSHILSGDYAHEMISGRSKGMDRANNMLTTLEEYDVPHIAIIPGEGAGRGETVDERLEPLAELLGGRGLDVYAISVADPTLRYYWTQGAADVAVGMRDVAGATQVLKKTPLQD